MYNWLLSTIFDIDALPSQASEPLVGYECHFGHTVYAVGNIPALITKGMIQLAANKPEESLTTEYVCGTLLFSCLSLCYTGSARNFVFSRSFWPLSRA